LGRSDLLPRGVGGLTVLQKFAYSQNAGQRIIEFMGHAANHRAHGSQALALHNLVFEFLFHRDVAYGNDHAPGFGFRVEKLAGGSPHRTPAAVPVPRPIFRCTKNPDAGSHIVMKRHQLRRMILGL